VQNHTHFYYDDHVTGWANAYASGTTDFFKGHERHHIESGTVTGANETSTETRPVNMKVIFIMKCWHQSDD
jgi:hypothetical protein